MSAPFYKVSILTFSPCGGIFPAPTATGRDADADDCETGKGTKTRGNLNGLAGRPTAGRGAGRTAGDDKTADIEETHWIINVIASRFTDIT